MPIANSVANISSTFVIHSQFDAGTGTYRIDNPGRSFRVIQVLGTGLNSAVITLRKNSGAGDVVAVCTLATGDLNDFQSVITQANANFTASDNLFFSVTSANATGVNVLCVATGGGEALTTADLT